jgi:hypothetical protein
LPDNLKKRADRLYPVGVGVVALAVKNRDERALGVLAAMTEAVQETYADGHGHQPQVVRARILEKREQFLRRR